MVKKAIITDAGFASRYLPITKTIPKGMLPMGNKPIMQLVVEECVEAGIEEIIIVATPEGRPIYEDYFNNSVNRIRKQLESQGKLDRYRPVEEVLNFPKIFVIEQDQSLPYGNGSPILSAKGFVEQEEAFLVIYSDDLVLGKYRDAQALVDEYKKNKDVNAIIIATEIEKEQVSKYGIISLKDENKLDTIIEKPDEKDAPSNLASYGRYLLKPNIFDYLRRDQLGKDNELWTVDAITKLAKDKGNVQVLQSKATWVTTGDPDNYFKAYLTYLSYKGKIDNKKAEELIKSAK